MDEHVRMEIADRVAILTLNRPERRNAFSGVMGRQLGEAYARCDDDDEIRAVVVTGAGDVFCAGADLEPGGDTFAKPGRKFTASPVRPPAWKVRKPVIAAVNGHAVGIGLTLAMQCDLRFVADDAKLAFAHVRRGVLPDMQSHWTVPRTIGFARTAELFLTGRTFSGREAVELGLALRALPTAEVVPAALEVAYDIALNTAPVSVALSKQILWSRGALDEDEAERMESAAHRVVMGGSDAREGVLAWLEKREPKWEGSVAEQVPPED